MSRRKKREGENWEVGEWEDEERLEKDYEEGEEDKEDNAQMK